MKKVVYTGGSGEIVEKKSRFIATIKPVTSEQEALDFIGAKKKEYWDARHNCYAYIIGKNQELMRCSDDGEPAQTAGRPMLDVLIKEEIYNVVVVVTRYFGGVLLGTGGLVRAYQGAVKAGLENCVLLEESEGYPLTITTDYNGYGKIEYLLRERDIVIQNTEFGQDVQISVTVTADDREDLTKEIADKTSGDAELLWGDFVSFGRNGKEIIIFEKNT
ncbi:MAG: YigZ family protein [Lachnospiraceae bacterium]|nr:YigZ family protein [Lachnospiraceae bacterium]MDD6192862.1 YigZ family protein [Lachnospiraceae bacterium]MDY4792957.1 YigZ family protein [Pararoseburia sp.]